MSGISVQGLDLTMNSSSAQNICKVWTTTETTGWEGFLLTFFKDSFSFGFKWFKMIGRHGKEV